MTTSTFTGYILAAGQVATSEGALYTCPANTYAYLKNVNLYNTNAATQTVQLWVKKVGATARKWRLLTLALDQSASALEGESALNLGPGDAIEAATTTGSAVDFWVSGVEEVRS